MKTRLFKLLALLFIVSMNLACTNDDNNNLSPQIDEVVGFYKGNMKVTVGNNNISLPDVPITVTMVSDHQVELTLKNLDAIEIMVTDVNVVCEVSEDGNDLNLAGTGSAMVEGEKISVGITGDIDGGKLDIDINLSLTQLGYVVADYNGVKQ